jgi:NADH dehydrogenase
VILVVGATGSLGGQITRGLVEQGKDVRVLVRPESPYRPLVDLGCRAVIGDLKDPASLQRACQGVDTIVTTAVSVTRLPPDTIETVELAGYASLIDAATAAGVRHFVYTSALIADVTSPIPFAAAKAVTAERIMASGMTWTVLAPDAFMDVWLAMVVAGPAFEGREVVYVGGGDRVHQFVHSQDVAAIAIACVDNPRAANRFIPIGGPAAISFREVVATFEGVLGRSIPHRGVAPGEPVPGFPPMIAGMLASFDVFDSRLDMDELSAEFGLELTTVQAWARSMAPVPVR